MGAQKFHAFKRSNLCHLNSVGLSQQRAPKATHSLRKLILIAGSLPEPVLSPGVTRGRRPSSIPKSPQYWVGWGVHSTVPRSWPPPGSTSARKSAASAFPTPLPSAPGSQGPLRAAGGRTDLGLASASPLGQHVTASKWLNASEPRFPPL